MTLRSLSVSRLVALSFTLAALVAATGTFSACQSTSTTAANATAHTSEATAQPPPHEYGGASHEYGGGTRGYRTETRDFGNGTHGYGNGTVAQGAGSVTDIPGRSRGVLGSSPNPTPASSETSADPGAPEVTARVALLVDGFGRVLYEKNADARVPCASTQKLLLGILIVENGDLGRTVTVQESDTRAEPTKMGIQTGETYTRAELLRTVLVRSSNDIARALARDHSGSVSAFAAAMNRRARSLGMYDSHFTNASGLPTPPGQYSTARDLVKLCNAALRKPFIRDAVRTKRLVFRFDDGRTETVHSTNKVLRRFPNCIGAKTGYTHDAGRCLVSVAEGGRKRVTSVILGSETPEVWDESEALLKYGLGM